jgi:hypothetical protein
LAAGSDVRFLQVLQVDIELHPIVAEQQRQVCTMVNRMTTIADQKHWCVVQLTDHCGELANLVFADENHAALLELIEGNIFAHHDLSALGHAAIEAEDGAVEVISAKNTQADQFVFRTRQFDELGKIENIRRLDPVNRLGRKRAESPTMLFE